MNRRHFLQSSAALAAAGFHARLFAAPRPVRGRLLVVFLRGGYDAASALVPVGSDFYYEARPTLAIPRPDPENPLAAVRLDDYWGLHPELARGLAPLLARRQVAFVPFSGVPDASRSHFQVQDLIEMGADGQHPGRRQEGLLYRLARHTDLAEALTFTPAIPLCFKGAKVIPNIQLQAARASRLRQDERAEIAQLYAGHPLGDVMQKAEELRAMSTSSEDLAQEMQAASRGAGPAGLFKAQARSMARYLKRDYNLAFAAVGGWDTHVAQGSSKGYLAAQFASLADGLSIFSEEMGRTWEETQVVVVSEFGRTFRENGTGGTDHGHGTVYWVLGGRLSSPPVQGPRLVLAPETLNEQRDYPVLVDYRSLLAEVAGLSFGLSKDALVNVFGSAPGRLLQVA